MRRVKMTSGRWFLMLVFFAAAFTAMVESQAPQASGVTVFEGARLIVGDGSAPIENAAFVVQNDRFAQVGRRGQLKVPAGAARVDLTGKTVIPALVDGHSHIGYMKNLTSGAMNYTRENILDHMYQIGRASCRERV